MRAIYIVGAILITLGSFALMISGALTSVFGGSVGVGGVLGGIALLTLGNLGWRLLCESIIVIFNIHDRLVSIDNKTNTQNQPTQTKVSPKKFCKNCGNHIVSKDKFCATCGKNLTE